MTDRRDPWQQHSPETTRAALEEAIAVLRRADLYPVHLYAYALMLDARELRDEFNADCEGDTQLMTWRDAVATSCESDLEDGRDEVLDLYGQVEAMLDHLHADEADVEPR